MHSIPPSPPGVSVFDNMDYARGIGWPEFLANVQNKGAWDYKRQGRQYENFGNFNFGATGWALGVPDNAAERAAGYYQEYRGAGGGTSHFYAGAPYGDQFTDNQQIQLGQALARDYFAGACSK